MRKKKKTKTKTKTKVKIMCPLIITIKAKTDFKDLAAFKKWAVAQLDLAIGEATSEIECRECRCGETCFRHGKVKMVWRTGCYVIRNSKEALTKVKDGIRKMSTTRNTRDVGGCAVSVTGSSAALDNVLVDGSVTFKPGKRYTLMEHIVTEERLCFGPERRVETRKGFRLPVMEGFEFLSLFAWRVKWTDWWYVSDLRTGLMTMSKECRTKTTAIRAAKGFLRAKGREETKIAFDANIKKYGDLLTDERGLITENPNKENDMRLTKTDDKFDGLEQTTKAAKSAVAKSVVAKPTVAKTVKAAKPKKATKIVKAAKPKRVTKTAKANDRSNLAPKSSEIKKIGAAKTVKAAKVVKAGKRVRKGMKRCSRCKAVKPLADYSLLTKSPDGKLGHCKACENVYQLKRRKAGKQ